MPTIPLERRRHLLAKNSEEVERKVDVLEDVK
jgi:hypothetical protein